MTELIPFHVDAVKLNESSIRKGLSKINEREDLLLETTVDHLIEIILKNEAVLWGVFVDGVVIGLVVTLYKVNYVTNKKSVVVYLVVGIMEGGQELVDTCLNVIENYAKHLECDMIEVWGRPGWRRVLRTKDFTHRREVLIKIL